MLTATPTIDAMLSTPHVETYLLVQTKNGAWKRAPVEFERRVTDDTAKIVFTKSDRLLKDTIKSLVGSKWHADELVPYWSAVDCPRNRFQLEFLVGGNPYAWFDRPLEQHEYHRSLFTHQREGADHFLTYHFGIMGVEMGGGKTLTMQEVIERSGTQSVWWVGPKSSLPNIEREFRKWGLDPAVKIDLMSYEQFVKKANDPTSPIVQVLIFDEASKLKNPTSLRSAAAQQYADKLRERWGYQGYVILATGTPSPKSPADWWSLCEIAYPGFLREGSRKALEQRLGVFADKEYLAGTFSTRVAWKDDERRCAVCGALKDDLLHTSETEMGYHQFRPVKNEVAYLYDRLKGLTFIRHKKDVLPELPDKTYRTIECTPAPSLLRAAKLIAETADSAITALTKLRELSDGFQYAYDNGERKTQRVACPKDAALRDLLEEAEDTGRIVIFGGFDGTLDRIQEVCHKSDWVTIRVDGNGIRAYDAKGVPLKDRPGLDYWYDDTLPRVAFVAHPESGGMSFTLVEARMAVFYSNTYKPEYRAQAEDRIHRPGMDLNKGCVIVDLLHLPTDAKVLETLRANRRIEKMTMGDLSAAFATAA